GTAVTAHLAPFPSLSALNSEITALLPALRHRLACLHCVLPFSTASLALVEALCSRELWDEAAVLASDASPPLTRLVTRHRAYHALKEGKYADARDLWRSLLSPSKGNDKEDR